MKLSVKSIYLVIVAILAINNLNNLSLVNKGLLQEIRVSEEVFNYAYLENYEYHFYETPILSYANIPRGSVSFDIGIPLGYQITKLYPNDIQPTLVVWFPRRIIFWNVARGAVAEFSSAQNYFSKPILIDLDNDNVLDYFVFVYNQRLDGYPAPTNQPFIEVRDTWGNIIVRYINSNVYIDSQTHYMYSYRLFIPWIRSTQSDSQIGLIEINFSKQFETRIHTIANFSGSCSVSICDHNTNYEVYVIGYNDKIFLFPSGSDTVLVVNIEDNSVKLVETISLGYETLNDNLVLLARNRVSLHIAGEGYNQAIQPFAYEWFGSRGLKASFDGRFLVIPYGNVLVEPTTIYYGGIWYPVRIEQVRGVIVLDMLTKTYRYINMLRPILYKGLIYTPTSLVSISVNPTTKTIYYGGLAYARTSPYRINYIYYVGLYRYDTNSFTHPLWVEELSTDINSKNINIALSSDGAVHVSPEKVKLTLSSTTLDYILHKGRTGTYWTTKTIILNPMILDLDGDGALDVLFILYYALGDGTLFSGNYVFTWLIPKLVDTRSVYVVWFTIPRSKITLQYSDETKSQTLYTLEYVSKGESNLTLTIKYQDGTVVFSKTYRVGNYSGTIFLNKAGNYTLSLKSISSYRVGTRIDLVSTLVTYVKDLDLTVINVRYPTRILLEEPRISRLTPNLYINGLKLVFKLERYDWEQKRWVSVSGTEIELSFKYLDKCYCYVIKDYVLDEPPSPPPPKQPPRPIPLFSSLEGVDYVVSCNNSVQSDLSFNGITKPWNGDYGIVIGNLIPETFIAEIRVRYKGSNIDLPVETSIDNFYLIKYPVMMSIEVNDTYALRNHVILVSTSYLYYDPYGNINVAGVPDGYVTYRLVNMLNKSTIITGKSPINNGLTLITISKEYVLPGKYSIEAFFEHSSNLYSATGVNGNYTVHKLGFRTEAKDLLFNRSISNEDVVTTYSLIRIYCFETTDSTADPISTGLHVMVIDTIDNRTILVNYTFDSFIDIDFNTLEENKTYLLIVEPSSYRWIYEPCRTTYLLKTAPLGKVVVHVEPLLEISSSTDIYALTMNKVYLKIVFENPFRDEIEQLMLRNANTTLWIGGEKHVLNNTNEAILWYPLTQGLWNITGEIVVNAGFRNIVIIGSRIVMVKPMPTYIDVRRGSIEIDVYDLLGRRANGTLEIEVRSLSGKLIYKNTYKYDLRTVIVNVEPNDWVVLQVVFRGNGSYADSWRQLLIDLSYNLHRPVPVPINEPYTTPIIFITLLVAIIVSRKKRIGEKFVVSR
ncbi:MAG: hypothetical protein QXT47_00060 [Desulfurococcaceae archaeon]